VKFRLVCAEICAAEDILNGLSAVEVKPASKARPVATRDLDASTWYKYKCVSRKIFGSRSKRDTPRALASREIARKMNVPEGTVLARAKREGWTQQIESARHAAALTQSNAIAPLQSIVAVMQERGERYRERRLT
jgi:hypothetical protein